MIMLWSCKTHVLITSMHGIQTRTSAKNVYRAPTADLSTSPIIA